MHCYYRLQGIGERGVCPECASPFDLTQSETFIARPPIVRWKFWLPGLVLPTLVGVAFIAVFLPSGYTSAGLWFGLPIAIGCILGYGGSGRPASLVLLGLAVVGSIVLSLLSMNLSGLFCGLVLAGLFIVPVLIGIGLGALCGRAVRTVADDCDWFRRRSCLDGLVFLLIPVTWTLLEGKPAGQHGLVTIVTSETIHVAPAEAWNSLMFYEEVRHKPPLLLRLGLPTPLRTSGNMSRDGDVKVCTYKKGELRKRITHAVPNERLAFDVIRQEIGFERSVRLVDGSFELIDSGRGQTTLNLTTRYEPLLTPRSVWRPIERLAAQTLHRHVIEGIRIDAEANRAEDEESLVIASPSRDSNLAWGTP